MTLAFIGTGSMGTALLAGVIAGGCDPAEIIATTKSADSARRLEREHGVRALALDDDPDANRSAAAEADCVLLGVKPWMVKDTAAEVGAAMAADAVLVSMAAGVTLEQLAAASGREAVVRIMPNTPARSAAGSSRCPRLRRSARTGSRPCGSCYRAPVMSCPLTRT